MWKSHIDLRGGHTTLFIQHTSVYIHANAWDWKHKCSKSNLTFVLQTEWVLYVFTFWIYYHLLNAEFIFLIKTVQSMTSYHNLCCVQRNWMLSLFWPPLYRGKIFEIHVTWYLHNFVFWLIVLFSIIVYCIVIGLLLEIPWWIGIDVFACI